MQCEEQLLECLLECLPVQMGFYQDWYGPATVAGLIMFSLIAILVLAIVDLAKAGF